MSDMAVLTLLLSTAGLASLPYCTHPGDYIKKLVEGCERHHSHVEQERARLSTFAHPTTPAVSSRRLPKSSIAISLPQPSFSPPRARSPEPPEPPCTPLQPCASLVASPPSAQSGDTSLVSLSPPAGVVEAPAPGKRKSSAASRQVNYRVNKAKSVITITLSEVSALPGATVDLLVRHLKTQGHLEKVTARRNAKRTYADIKADIVANWPEDTSSVILSPE